MNEKNILKIYEIILFSVALPFFLFQVFSGFSLIFILIDVIGFFILLPMYIGWVVLLKLSKIPNLSNFEIIIFILLWPVISKLVYLSFSFLGYVGAVFFGLYIEQFLLILFMIFITIAMLFWFFSILKNSKSKEQKKFSINRIDLIMIFIGVAFFILLLTYYIITL